MARDDERAGPDALVGTVIDGRYELVARIGEADSGVLYRAWQRSIERTVAIRVLRAASVDEPAWVQRFHDRARAWARLQHPNTIRLFDADVWRGRAFVAMEHLDGVSLREALSTGPMAPQRVLKIVIQCCAALGEAHALGLVHGALEPRNVLVLNQTASPDYIKLLDFSVDSAREDSGMMTHAGVVSGSLEYMPPEAVYGLPLDARSDLYALGVVAFELLTGSVPFGDGSPIARLHSQMRPLAPSIPDAVKSVVLRALELDPARRFQSATEMMQRCVEVFDELARGGMPIGGGAQGRTWSAQHDPFAKSAPPTAGVPALPSMPRPGIAGRDRMFDVGGADDVAPSSGLESLQRVEPPELPPELGPDDPLDVGAPDFVVDPPTRPVQVTLSADGDAGPTPTGQMASVDAPTEQPGRAVDIALYRRGLRTRLEGERGVVTPTTRLAAKRRYQVVVQIGRRQAGSLFAESPPPIDPLLAPSEEGHALEVALFPLDFTLTRPSVQPLWLPRSGPSEAVTFDVRAPEATGPARFRVLVSHGDHTVQAFLVTTQVAASEESAPTRVLIATIERAATARFDNLDQLRPRGATAIVDRDPAGSHAISLKRGGVTGTFTFSDDKIRGAATAVRSVLEDAARSQRFDEPPPAAGSPPAVSRTAAYHVAIRALAALGANLRLALFDNADAGGKQIIRDLARSADQVVELIHVARSLVIPWATIYDGWIPNDLDTSQLEVCDGVQADGTPCGHGGNERLLCVRRFWGLRHDLELVLGSSSARDAITALHVPVDRPPLRVIHGKSLQDAAYMPDDYVRLLYQPGVPVWEHDVYALLEAERRPAIVVAMGHFSLATPVAGAVVHAIDLVPAPLTNVGVSQQTLNLGDWTAPHSIILLMACSSGVAAADALTGMIDAFGSAGASAVIGTESTVFPRLSARAACSIYHHLARPDGSLARALRALRWELARGASPLGFTFTAYGNADLAMAEDRTAQVTPAGQAR